MADIVHAFVCVFYAARYLNIAPAVMGLYQKVSGTAPLLAALKGRFRLFTFSPFDENTTISPFHLFTFSPFHLFTFSPLTKTPRFHIFTFSPFHLFTLSISRYDAIALYLAPDGNHLTAVAVAAWAARLFSLLPWNLDNLARCALQTLTLQCPVIGIGVGAGGYIDRITPGHCRRGSEDK